MKAQIRVLSETIEAIYATGASPERWPDVLESMSDQTVASELEIQTHPIDTDFLDAS